VALQAQTLPDAAVGTQVPIARSLQEFWNLNTATRATRVQFDFECVITFNNPEWNQLWVGDENAGCFVHDAEIAKDIPAGTRIRVAGSLEPGQEMSFKNATITPLRVEKLKPLEMDKGVEQHSAYADRLVRLEAVVDRQESFGVGRQQLYLSVEGRLVHGWLLFNPDKPPPSLVNTVIRATGVYAPKVTPMGGLANLAFHIASSEQVRVVAPLASAPRFNTQPVNIGSLPQHPANSTVLIRGRVVSQAPGHYLTLRDATGQVTVLSAQTIPCRVGSWVEALGSPRIAGVSWELSRGVYRRISEDNKPIDTGLSAISLAAQLAELTPEQAASGMPVFLSGVVTWSNPDSPFFFIQDSSGGACIYRGSDTNKVRPPGRSVEITGITSLGDFAPAVMASKVVKTGDGVIPVSHSISLEHALGGTAEAQWVELRGFLRRIHRETQWTRLEMATPAGDFNALLPASATIPDLTGSVLRIQGVCNAQTNQRRQIKAIQLWVPGPDNIQIEQEAPKDIFDTPARNLASIGQFGAPIATNLRVRLSGTVLQHNPGHSLFLYDQGESILIQTRDAQELQPGDRIDAVGFLNRQGSRIILREATCRRTGHGPEPSPVELTSISSPQELLNGRLVNISAVLANTTEIGDITRLVLQRDGQLFEALLSSRNYRQLPDPLSPGSTLLIRGVYELKYDEAGIPLAFQIHLRTTDDLTVTQTPSWFTRNRIIGVAGALLIGVLLFLSWVVALRRRVNRQTHMLREQLQRETRMHAELERAGKLESLGLLAGGIAHDFNNLLTIILGNLSLTSTDERLCDESKDCLHDATSAVMRAKDLTQQLLTFAKGGAPLRTAQILPDIVREVATFSTRGSKVATEFDFEDKLAPAHVDKGQISQVVQNLTINAVQAMPNGGLIRFSLRNEKVTDQFGPILRPGQYLLLSIADNGPGIPAANLPKIFDPYFTTKKTGSGIGLATVHSIIRKHLGHISVESTIGKGTCFRIWLPVASTDTEGDNGAPAALAPTRLQGRVLVMDDEPEVRRLVSAILKRVGVEVTTAHDGAEAISLYQAAREKGTPFDLIILDLTVPGGLGGIQVMEQLRKSYPNVRAIVSSGYSSELSVASYEECGFLDVVPKPYEMGDLTRILAKHLKHG